MRRTKTAPSPYPFLPFHGLRIAQATASMVVAAVMFYFIWNLVHEHYQPPKTFWTVSIYGDIVGELPLLTKSQLLAAALLTFFTLSGTLLMYACFGLSPLVNLSVNGLLLALWAPGFAFLWYWSRGTLSHYCDRTNWTGPTGIMVCRLYKALFAFALLGL
jgi:hypothetical protein